MQCEPLRTGEQTNRLFSNEPTMSHVLLWLSSFEGATNTSGIQVTALLACDAPSTITTFRRCLGLCACTCIALAICDLPPGTLGEAQADGSPFRAVLS